MGKLKNNTCAHCGTMMLGNICSFCAKFDSQNTLKCIECGKPGRKLNPGDGHRVLCNSCYIQKKYKDAPKLTKTYLDNKFPIDDSIPDSQRRYHIMRRASILDSAGLPWKSSNGALRTGSDLPEEHISVSEHVSTTSSKNMSGDTCKGIMDLLNKNTIKFKENK